MRATRLRLRGGALLVAATLMSGACGVAQSPSESAPTPTPGQASPVASPTASVTASVTVSPSAPAPVGRWVPGLADVPGDGVLMVSGIAPPADAPEVVPDMWRFEPTTGWHEQVTERAPVRWDDRLSYDAGTGVVWLAVGAPDDTGREIWSYDPATNEWTKIESEGGPAGGGGYYVAFDSESRQLIHFGGYAGDDFENQTWAYGVDSGLWQEMDPSQRPAGRHAAVIEYDASSDRVVLYGGWGSLPRPPNWFYDTWTYDFNTDTWTEMAPGVSPWASSGGATTYDAAGERLLLFGGGGSYVGAQTWAYDFANDTWTEVAAAAGPSPREVAGMAYDAESGVVVLFGGRYPGTSTTPDDTWLFDTVTDSWREWTGR